MLTQAYVVAIPVPLALLSDHCPLNVQVEVERKSGHLSLSNLADGHDPPSSLPPLVSKCTDSRHLLIENSKAYLADRSPPSLQPQAATRSSSPPPFPPARST